MATESAVAVRYRPTDMVYPIQTGIWRIRNHQRNPSDIAPESNIFGDNLDERSKGRHWGWDLEALVGSPIYAVRSGTVTSVAIEDYSSGYGPNHVWHTFVFNGVEYEAGYCHLSQVHVSVGQSVSAGMRIGNSGQTGQGSPPHLHLEFLRGSTKINPTTFFGSPPI